MYCVNCGVRLQEGEEACPLCGTAVPAVVKPEARPAYPDRYPLVQKKSRALVVWLLTAVMAAVGLGCLVFCLRTMHRAAWSGIVLMSLALCWVWFLFPMLFDRYWPMFFVPLDVACLAGFLLYICWKTGGRWFLSFAFPVTMIAGTLIVLGIVLFRFIRQGRLLMLSLFLILIGGSFLLIEFFQHITFGTPMFVWSLYCVCVFGALGLFLLIASMIPSLRAALMRKFFI